MEGKSLDLQIQVPAKFGTNCQFCDGETSALQCNCEVGALLCAVWQASTEPRSQFPWEKLRRLINDAEQSLNKRQKTESAAASSSTNPTTAPTREQTSKPAQPVLRKASQVGAAEWRGQIGAGSEAEGKVRNQEAQDNKEACTVRTVLSLFNNLVVSATGVPHFKSGAVDYKTYLERGMQLGGEITDQGLPQTEEEEVRYEGEGRRGYWVALNEADEHTGRKGYTSLEVHTVTNWSLAV